MKMIGELFKEENLTVEDNRTESGAVHCVAVLTPVKECVIFAAHFPGQPVVPGACIVATVGELVCRVLQSQWYVSTLKNVKFISLIEPKENEPVTFDMNIDVPAKKVKVVVMYCEAVCCKMSLTIKEL